MSGPLHEQVPSGRERCEAVSPKAGGTVYRRHTLLKLRKPRLVINTRKRWTFLSAVRLQEEQVSNVIHTKD